MTRAHWLGVAVALFGLAAQAQDPLRRGADIVANGVGDSVPACAACHAANGVTDGSGNFPRLTGQSAWYMIRQLADYASGVRANAIMAPIAKALSDNDRAAVAGYFAASRGPFLLPKPADATLLERGRQLARVGDQARALPACNNCHGPGGTGEFPAIPYLAGQYADYTSQQLKAWQTGSRKSSPEGMADIARRLDDRDVAAISAYYQQLREGSAAAAK